MQPLLGELKPKGRDYGDRRCSFCFSTELRCWIPRPCDRTRWQIHRKKTGVHCDMERTHGHTIWNIALAQSVFATLLMSIERYICIVHEKTYSKYIQFDKTRVILFLQWVMPATLLVFLVRVPEFLAQNLDVRIEIGKNGNKIQKFCPIL